MEMDNIFIERSLGLKGTVELLGAKNSALVIMASLILTSGKSVLSNVPFSDDITNMMALLSSLGAHIKAKLDNNTIEVDTADLNKYCVSPLIMKKMRASILVMGPLLARFGHAKIALPGGCGLGKRPIDYHLKAFSKMGVSLESSGDYLNSYAKRLSTCKFVLEYPSVGATENIMMASVLVPGQTQIINASLEPEVLDLIAVLRKMGAKINIALPAVIEIEGVTNLNPIEHSIIFDRLEAGSLLLAAAITGGEINLPQAPAYLMDVFLDKLKEMGHDIAIGADGTGIFLKATKNPQAVSFKTMPYPGFPTDLQAPMMATLCLANGTSIIDETVFENRLSHAYELKKLGADIKLDGQTAIIKGVAQLHGTKVIASDIRSSYALVLAGLAAQGNTIIKGLHHLKRGYQNIDEKLKSLGAKIVIQDSK